MKLVTISTVLFFYTVFPSAHAQLNPSYTIESSGSINFQTVTASGSWLVGSDGALAAYNQQDGKKMWENEGLSGLKSDQITEIPGSSLLMIQQNNNVQFLDPFTGEVRFSTAKQGLEELSFHQLMYLSNSLLVAGNKGKDKQALMLVDLSTGQVRWTLEEKFGKIITANEFNKDEMLLVTLFHVYRLQNQSGKIVWKETTSESADALTGGGALGAALGAMAEQMAANITFNLRYYEQPEKDLFIIGSEVENKQTTSDGKTTITYTNNYTAFKLSSGKRIWKQPIEMKGKFGVVLFHNDDVLVLPDDGNRTNINAFDLSTGEGKWGKKGKGINLKGGVYDAFITPKGILLISGTKNNTFLNFLDPQAGVLTFEKPLKVGGEVVKLMPAGEHFAFVTTEEMNILNPATGELLLEKSLSTTPDLTALDGTHLLVADPKKGTLTKVNLQNAQAETLFAAGIKFEEKESPTRIEVRENGYLLTSDQNLALISKTGTLTFHKYFKAPRESGWKQALLYAQAARAAYISANAYYAAGVLKSSAPKVSEEDAVGGALVQGLGQVYESIGDQAQNFAKKSIEQARARAKSTTQSRDFMLVLADNGKEFALVKVNKNTGETEAEIGLGKDKEPQYAVDEITNRVFRKTSATAIASYQL